MTPAQPLLSGVDAAHGAVAVGLGILALLVIVLVELCVRRRNERQVREDRLLRKGMKGAARRGWLPEDTQ